MPLFDGDAVDLHVKPSFHSAGMVAGLDGGLLTWEVDTRVKGHALVYGNSLTREIDTLTQELGGASALNLQIRGKPTYQIDIDQLAGGNVIVSWIEQPLRFPGSASFYRIYDVAGHAVTDKTAFPAFGKDGYMSVHVTALAGGGFCSSFATYRYGSSESYAQVYAADGTATSAAFRMNAGLAGDQNPLGITDLGGGRFITLWQDRQPTGDQSVMGRVFDTAGVAQGKGFMIARAPAEMFLRGIDTVALANGDVVVTWLVYDQTTGQAVSLHGRILHANGKPAGEEMILATPLGQADERNYLDSPAVVALKDGRWMVAWSDERYDSAAFDHRQQGFARIYNTDGTLSVDSFDLAPGHLDVTGTQLVVLADGRVAVHYDTSVIFSQRTAWVQILDPRLAAIALTGTEAGDQYKGTDFGDSLGGGNGRDRIAGGDGDDGLSGGALADTLMGNTGNDTLDGGLGDDSLTGGIGRDSFVFTAGHDRVTDFKLGQDVLNLHSLHFATAADAQSHMTQGAEGAEFAFGGDVVVLVGVAAADLGAGSLVL